METTVGAVVNRNFLGIEFDYDTVLIGGFVHNTCVALVPLVSS